MTCIAPFRGTCYQMIVTNKKCLEITIDFYRFFIHLTGDNIERNEKLHSKLLSTAFYAIIRRIRYLAHKKTSIIVAEIFSFVNVLYLLLHVILLLSIIFFSTTVLLQNGRQSECHVRNVLFRCISLSCFCYSGNTS